MRPLARIFGACLALATLVTACGGASNSLATGDSLCFRGFPVARAAVHRRGTFLGVKRVETDHLTRHIALPLHGVDYSVPSNLSGLQDKQLCAFAFKGSYLANSVEMAATAGEGRYAIVLVNSATVKLVAAFVFIRLPSAVQPPIRQAVIKYIGSKRRLVPAIGRLAQQSGATSAVDLFTGTTRVAQEWKRNGIETWAVDTARYAEVLARCYLGTDARAVDTTRLDEVLSYLGRVAGVDGYFTSTFADQARFFQPDNARRIDAIRGVIAEEFSPDPLEAVLLTSLLEAADRVDSTTGLQMAYLKSWSPRSYRPLELRRPLLLEGPGHAWRGDAVTLVNLLPEVDLAYLDPPYNQHRYFTNYHVWETLVAYDAPEHYGIACKRADARLPGTRSAFNSRRTAPAALAQVIAEVKAGLVVLSASNEGWYDLDDLISMCEVRGHVAVMAFDSRRYIGSQIGIHNPRGLRVGQVTHTRNVEYLLVAGDSEMVRRACEDRPELVIAAFD